ncbi:hypothetical protein Vi05172_g5026 [Venturia inaequalis]|nr:hypothetical protein Vi05172_g5026 [Venturia inaequalis]
MKSLTELSKLPSMDEVAQCTSFRLLDLAPELRNLVYHHAFHGNLKKPRKPHA